MHKTSEKIAKQKKVLTKAVLSSAKQLGLTMDQLAIVINLDSVETLNSLELDPDSSQGELAIILIRIAISLDALTAGIGVNTVSNLEAGRNVSFENLVRVAMVLGRLQELEELFKPHLNSVDDILRYESNTARQRIKRK
ncbi:hypothetical protein [Acinetobacter towneri]|uniref:hypothetical protein n=1 Tax=Acinetobacter towneri TaxID=202956 RepID=UPI002934C56C|nr:hypothetical protein [Acinetobacter towneri]